jgi:hypothetical protein
MDALSHYVMMQIALLAAAEKLSNVHVKKMWIWIENNVGKIVAISPRA